jgi:hypothetical protein
VQSAACGLPEQTQSEKKPVFVHVIEPGRPFWQVHPAVTPGVQTGCWSLDSVQPKPTSTQNTKRYNHCAFKVFSSTYAIEPFRDPGFGKYDGFDHLVLFLRNPTPNQTN